MPDVDVSNVTCKHFLMKFQSFHPQKFDGYAGSVCICMSVYVYMYVVQGHSSEVICVQFNNSGSHVATGSFDHTAIVWDTQTGR